VRVEAQAV